MDTGRSKKDFGARIRVWAAFSFFDWRGPRLVCVGTAGSASFVSRGSLRDLGMVPE